MRDHGHFGVSAPAWCYLFRGAPETTAYLNTALEEGDSQIFLLAMQDIAEANNVTISQPNEDEVNATPPAKWVDLNTILNHLGLRLSVEVASVA